MLHLKREARKTVNCLRFLQIKIKSLSLKITVEEKIKRFLLGYGLANLSLYALEQNNVQSDFLDCAGVQIIKISAEWLFKQ